MGGQSKTANPPPGPLDRSEIHQLVNHIRVLEFELTVIKPHHYRDLVAFNAFRENRRQTIGRHKARLWDATHKSRYFVRPKPPLGW
jgi:hypothetical protein